MSSALFPEENSSKVLGKKLIGVFSEPKLKWMQPSLQLVGLSVGKHHVLAWSSSGLLYSWGINYNGVVGVKDNGKNLNKVISTPTLVEMQMGNNPGIVFGLAMKEASMVINFRGRIYYWGRIFEGDDMVLNTVERLDVDSPSSDNEKTRFLKIVNFDNMYAAMSSKGQLYLLSKTLGERSKKPELSLLDIPSETPISDIALTPRSLLILYSTAPGDCAAELSEKMAAMEYEKNQALKNSDYLVPEETVSHDIDTKLRAKKSSMKKMRKNSANLTISVPTETATNKSQTKLPKQKGYQRLYEVGMRSKPNLMAQEITCSSPVISTLYTSLRCQLSGGAASSPTKTILESNSYVPADPLEPARLRETKPPPAVLPSDFDRRPPPALAQVNHAHGRQCRQLWLDLVNDGQADALLDFTLRHLVDKSAASEIKVGSSGNLPIKKILKPLKQTKVRGLGLEEMAKEGKEIAKNIGDGLLKESKNCQSLISLVELNH
jgi:hypothetical protein